MITTKGPLPALLATKTEKEKWAAWLIAGSSVAPAKILSE